MMLKRSFGGEDQFSGEEEDAAENGKIESPRPSSELSKPSSPNHPADPGIRKLQVLPTVVINERSSMIDASSKPSNLKNSAAINKDQVLESAKAEMGHVREENQRLKTVLARILKDYQSLQMQFYDINVQQEQQAKKSSTVSSASTDRDDEEAELVVSLSLGTTSSVPKRELEKVVLDMNSRKCNDEEDQEDDDHDDLKQGLSLGLDCKFQDSNSTAAAAAADALMEPPSSTQSPDKSFEGAKDEEMGEAWPPSRILKTVRSTSGNDEMSQQTHVKKTRVSVRTRCETPTMNDGCQWRKYGQKIAKGNPCPRAYYRCTVSPGCPVRKQVQRCSEDMSILITTYEGTHNHPLPISATAMASTTSAAACMLMAGSSSSSSAAFRNSINGTTSADLHGLNYFNSSDTSRTRPPFYISNHPISSSSNSHPTVTLDLTTPPSNYNRSFSSNFPSTATTRIFPSTGFNFSSSSEPNAVPTPWGNPGGGYLSSGNIHQSYNRTQFGSTFHAQPQELRYQPQLQRSNSGPPPQPPMSEVIAAATKVITSDPSFQSALVAAITSAVGNNGGGESFGHGHKWGGGQQIQGINSGTYSSGPAPPKGSGCAPTNYITCSSSSSSPPQGNLLFLPPLPLSTSKSTSASPVDKREHMN